MGEERERKGEREKEERQREEERKQAQMYRENTDKIMREPYGI